MEIDVLYVPGCPNRRMTRPAPVPDLNVARAAVDHAGRR
jgi:hypothetical protein